MSLYLNQCCSFPWKIFVQTDSFFSCVLAQTSVQITAQGFFTFCWYIRRCILNLTWVHISCTYLALQAMLSCLFPKLTGINNACEELGIALLALLGCSSLQSGIPRVSENWNNSVCKAVTFVSAYKIFGISLQKETIQKALLVYAYANVFLSSRHMF